MLSIADFTEEQMYAYKRLRAHTVAFVWLGVGRGKTAVTTAATEYQRRRYPRCDRVLVVGTRSLLTTTWPAEFEKWKHLQGVDYAAACNERHRGSMRESVRRDVIESMPTYLGINYESLVWFFDTYGDTEYVPRVLVLDEITYMKSHATKRFRELVKHTQWFYRRFGLTASPAPERYADLWAQHRCVSAKNRLGRNVTHFRTLFCTSVWNGVRWDYKVGERGKRMIEEALDPITINVPGKSDKSETFEVEVGWTPEGRRVYDAMERRFLAEVGERMADGKRTLIQAVSTAVGLNKMRQMCGGFVYETGEAPKDTKAHALDALKLDALEELVDSLNGEAPLVFYQFGYELELIRQRMDIVFTMDQPGVIEEFGKRAWDHNKRVCFALHPKSAGHGVDGLQHGTQTGVWYSLPWSAEQYIQARGRLEGGHRNKGCAQFYLLMRSKSVDHDVYDKLSGKLADNAELLKRVGRRQKGK